MKINKLYLVFVLSFFCAINTNAQKLSRIELSVMPLSLLQTTQPHLRSGLKIFPLKKVAIACDFGYGKDFIYYLKDNVSNYSYYSFRPEIDYSILKTDEHNLYIGLEYFYYKKTNTSSNGYAVLSDYNLLRFSSADYSKQKEGIHIKTGLSVYTKSHFFIDIYGGIGIRRKFVEYSNITNGVVTEEYYHFLNFPEKIGFVNGTNLTLGFKCGFYL